ncbi:hypothetical protein [Bacillus sp. T33-2]|uniref:hypothetical protein n=1 Tax=Bacillus sp. T33-2 TaxID=2054168 RepID=UPI0015E10195|nr:hypothetical protein [Bacillus sp. T33-2]
MRFEFNPEVRLLLVNHSNEKVRMDYINHAWPMPKIAPRPPCYINPRYEMTYPLI